MVDLRKQWIQILCLCAFFIYPLNSSYSQESPSVLSPIDEVVLYPSQARVFRTVEFPVGLGTKSIRFTNVNGTLEPKSISVEPLTENIKILSVRTNLVRDLETSLPELEKLEAEKNALNDKKVRISSERSRWIKDLKGIEEYSRLLTHSISDPIQTGNAKDGTWEAAIDLLSRRRNSGKLRIQSLDKEESNLIDQIASIQSRINKIQSNSGRISRNLDISYQSSGADRAKIRLSYLVPNSGWKVSYSMESEERSDSVNISLYGEIRQESGEDWKQVRLLLSTNQPSLGATRPPLNPIEWKGRIIRSEMIYQTREGDRRKMSPVREEESNLGMEATDDSELLAESSDATGGVSTLETRGESVSFRIPNSVDIPSQPRDQRIVIAEYKEQIVRKNLIIYSQKHNAYQKLDITNKRDFPLLAGVIQLFSGSTYLGRSRMNYTPIGHKFSMGFGKDSSLQIRRSVKKSQESGGPINRGKFFVTRIHFEIRNESDITKPFQLLERVPISQVDDIQVSIQRTTTSGYKESSPGILEWNESLPPRSKKEFILEYQVRTPEDFPGEFYGN